MEDFDVLILGGGQAGIPLAVKLADAGKRVLLCERKDLGGSCVNFGCTPTKAAIASAKVAHNARRAGDFGIVIPKVEVDFGAVLFRAQAIADRSRTSLTAYLAGHNVAVRQCHGRLTGRDDSWFLVSTGDETVRARNVVINSGARTKIPNIEGIRDVPFLHAGNWLKTTQLPIHIVFVGAGYIALEMAQFFRRMGSQVTVVGHGEIIAPNEDQDVSIALQIELEKEDIIFHLRSRVSKMQSRGDGIHVTVECDRQPLTILASHIFVASGRIPNTEDLGLETVGISLNENGGIASDERLSSSVAGLWISGDARGQEMFTHSAWDDHRILESQLVGDGSRTAQGRIIPHGLFTDPELGRVGLTETEARRQFGSDLSVAHFPMDRSGRAVEEGESSGFIKLLADRRNGKLVGAAVLATHGVEIIASYVTLMNAGASLHQIREAIYAHPTLAEAMQSAAAAVDLGFGTNLSPIFKGHTAGEN
jgi:pyruvate/2-oxoglutarate dehydrogenase complex dihydrolipoamide dehydrogenase (E3) component